MNPKTESLFWRLFEEAGVARAHFHTWWALRNIALPDFYETMADYQYVDFFHASNSAHFKLIFISLGKLLDRNSQSVGLTSLREEFESADLSELVTCLKNVSESHQATIEKVKKIRNQSVAHNQADVSRNKVYELNGVTADELRDLIDGICCALNVVADHLGSSNTISMGVRFESATLMMLKTLSKGQN